MHSLAIAQARADTIAAVNTGQTTTIALTTTLAPEVTAAELAAAQWETLVLVDEPIVFAWGEDTYPIDTDTLTGALQIGRDGTASLAVEKLQSPLDEIDQAVFTPARNVMLGWDDGLYVVADDVDGTAVDRQAMEQLLLETARTTSRLVPLPVMAVKAEARSANVDDLGIDGHLAYGSSSFAGSSETRATIC